MLEDLHPSPEPSHVLGRLMNWQSWSSELQRFAETLPVLYATDSLVALDRLTFWIASLTAVRTSAVVEARRQGSTWAQIARQVGMVRQSSWEGWHQVDPRPDTPPPRLLVADSQGRPWVRYEDGSRVDLHHPLRRIARGWWAGCEGCVGDDGPYDTVEAAERTAMEHACWRARR